MSRVSKPEWYDTIDRVGYVDKEDTNGNDNDHFDRYNNSSTAISNHQA